MVPSAGENGGERDARALSHVRSAEGDALLLPFPGPHDFPKQAVAEVRWATPEDVPQIAAIHQQRFNGPAYVWTRLGDPVLRALYHSYLDRTVAIVHSTAGRVDGFVVGGDVYTISRCVTHVLIHNWHYCVWPMATQPRLWMRCLRAFIKLMGNVQRSHRRHSNGDDYRLSAIAVAEGQSGKGIGRALVEAFEAAISNSARRYELSVLRTNSAAIRFYQRMGYQPVRENALSRVFAKEVAEAARTTLPFAACRVA